MWICLSPGLQMNQHQCDQKKSPIVYKSCPKIISLENARFWHLYKNCLRMWAIWANELLPKALKSCPTSNKSPNLVTLTKTHTSRSPTRPGAVGSDALHSRSSAPEGARCDWTRRRRASWTTSSGWYRSSSRWQSLWSCTPRAEWAGHFMKRL